MTDMTDISTEKLLDLNNRLEGELLFDETIKKLYATDASAYREIPLAVCFPKNDADIEILIDFAQKEKSSLIPRTAGTSLAGQVVGNGIIVDVSKSYNQILEINQEESWARIQPAVIRDDFNHHLKQYNLFYGPETSTSNRCMIGGMVGNNSCGSRSVIYGSAREHLLEIKGYLSDGSKVHFKSQSKEEFNEKLALKGLEGDVYRHINELLTDNEKTEEIVKEFPKENIPRRNTGYAVDMLLRQAPFTENGEDFNFCSLIAGSEGTLCFITELKVNLVPAPPKHIGVVCTHFDSIDDALKANIIALKHNPSACELIDHYILECTEKSSEHRENRFFVEGQPKAILVVEFPRESQEEVLTAAEAMEKDMRDAGYGYHFPVLFGEDISKVWSLRKAGLGLLSNIPGDAKAVAVIEDTAVDVDDLPDFIRDFNLILDENNMYCVHYAHAATGELHLRPIINLKTEEGTKQFRHIATEIAHLVKKYDGSLSGEHGDGRLRGEFIAYMIGEKNYAEIKKLKATWDGNNIFNPGKIVDAPAMDTFLRYEAGQDTPQFDTVLDFSDFDGMLRTAELCNGSADCRKTEISGGTMCPSYMATHDEKHTTRARANILREVMTNEEDPFKSEEIKDVMDLCLSCKGCKKECPSNVDVAKLKAEFTHQYHKENGVSFRSKMFANSTATNKLASNVPGLYNWAVKSNSIAPIIKKVMGVHKKRPLPTLSPTTVNKWYKKNKAQNFGFTQGNKQKLILFNDEFLNYNESHIAITAIKLLAKLGYQVEIVNHLESGRTWISKGILDKAQSIARKNIDTLHPFTKDHLIVGLEPSAVLTLRDEYIDFAEDKTKAKELADKTFLLDEFLAQELDNGNIGPELFHDKAQEIKMHGHCHQKALSSVVHTKKILSIPSNYKVLNIPSGCCGMAGSFGYEEEHYDVSMQVGELVLFPAVREASINTIIAAVGTSCRHQIKDGTGRESKHPVEILFQALK